MKGVGVILRNELFCLFISTTTYVSTFYFLCILGFGFRLFLESFHTTNWILPPLSCLSVGLIYGSPALIPFLTMRAIAEERRSGTLETLMSAPINAASLIIGKWCASYIFFLLICVGAYAYPLSMCLFYPEQAISLGFNLKEQWLGGITFVMIFGASFTAIGIFSSSITKNQMVAGMLTFSLISIFLGIMSVAYGKIVSVESTNLIKHFFYSISGSISGGLDKLQSFSVGVVHLSTILHQLILVLFFLALATLQIEKMRR